MLNKNEMGSVICKGYMKVGGIESSKEGRVHLATASTSMAVLLRFLERLAVVGDTSG